MFFLLILASMMIPYQAMLTPLYLLFSSLGLTNTHIGLAIVHTILQLPFSVYLMRNSFEGIPKEIEEASVMDGCTSMQTLRRVFLPLVLPGMVTVALFAFITSWNEFIAALIFMSRETSFTVPVMLTGVSTGTFGTVDWGALQAGRDRLDRPLPADLPAAAALLRLRAAQRRGEVAMDETRRGRPPRPSARAQLAARRSATSPTRPAVSIGTVSKALNNSGTLSARHPRAHPADRAASSASARTTSPRRCTAARASPSG